MLQPEVAIESDKCKMLWDFKVQTNHEINERRPDFYGVRKDKNICQIIDFAYPYEGRVDTKELDKKTLPRFRTRAEKDMEHDIQGYTITDMCPRNNTQKVKKLVHGNKY